MGLYLFKICIIYAKKNNEKYANKKCYDGKKKINLI